MTHQTFKNQLIANGVPPSIATQAASILANDDPSKLDLGRTPEDQHIIRSAYAWMSAQKNSK